MGNTYSREVSSNTICLTFCVDTLMAHVYETRKDPDGFVYITYTDETTLGGDE